MMTNVVLAACLAKASTLLQVSQLPIQLPLNDASVQSFQQIPVLYDSSSYKLVLTNGAVMFINGGLITTFEWYPSYLAVSAPADMHHFFGKAKSSVDDAVGLARRVLPALGFQVSDLFADLKPVIDGPHLYQGNEIPYVMISWPDPRGSGETSVVVDLSVPAIKGLMLSTWNATQRQRGNVFIADGQEISLGSLPNNTNILLSLKAVLSQLGVPSDDGRTTLDGIRAFRSCESCLELQYATGRHIVLIGRRILRFENADRFFHKEGFLRLSDYVGKWNIREDEIATRVAKLLKASGLIGADALLDSKPTLTFPKFVEEGPVPRVLVEWAKVSNTEMIGLQIEYDAEHDRIVSYIDQLGPEKGIYIPMPK